MDKNTINFGYIGYDSKEVIKSKLLNHDLFCHQDININDEQDLFSLINGLKSEKYDYIIIPAKNEDNEINDIFLSLISRLEIERINEIGMIIGEMHYHYHSLSSSGNATANPIDSFKSGSNTSTYNISSNDDENDLEKKIEYRIFKLNKYKTPLITRFGVWLLKNNHFKMILGLSSGFVAVAMFVFLIFRMIPSIDEKLEEISIMVELIATAIIIVLQLILRFANTEENIKRQLITGYWVYYSIEETDANQNFVPKGFRTRLVHISDVDDRLTFKCKFAGDDQVFFATDTLTFDYDQSLQMGRGFYYYTSNIQNNKKRRAEGTCRFEGEVNGNNQIMMMNGWFFSRGTSLTGKVLYYRISEEDYNQLQKSLTFYDLNNTRDNHVIIGVYGCKESNTDLAAHSEDVITQILDDAITHNAAYKDIVQKHSYNEIIEFCYFDTIKDMKHAILSRRIDYAIVPTANRGQVIEQHSSFFDHDLINIYQKEMEIKYVLGTLENNYNINEETVFYGHQQSYIQCRSFIKNHPYINTSSSSEAALNMSKGYYGHNSVVLCNENALHYYHLKPVVDENNNYIKPYQESVKNITTFTVFKKNL